MRASTLFAGLATPLSPADADPEIAGATLDVREAGPGVLFVARRDHYGDTHAQVGQALAAGSPAVLISRREAAPVPYPPGVAVAWAEVEDPTLGHLCARLYGAPTESLRVVGVTGTKGKTTTTWLVEHMLRAVGDRPALMGTLVYRLGDWTQTATNTTPDALVVQRFAAEARARGATSLVLEVSSHALQIERVAGVAFDAVGFTQLGRDHLDFHGTSEAYFEAKARLFGPCLSAARAAGKHPAAVLGRDTPSGDRMRARVLAGVPCAGVAPTERAAPADWAVHALDAPRLTGTRAALRSPAGEVETVETPLVGDFQLMNAALAAALVEAIRPGSWARAWRSLVDFTGVPGRLERVGERVFVDYAHTPESVARVLAALRARTDAPLTIVLGCGGDRDRGKRPEMARAAAAGADRVVLTSDNPRSEDPERILDDMAAGLPPGAPALRIADRALAIAAAVALPGIVLIAGKGHEQVQVVGDRALPFDDRAVARAALLSSGEPA